MKKRLVIVLALIAALSLVAAAPVSAGGEKPINGKIELNFVLEPCDDVPDGTVGIVSWVGTVVIDGTTYGWADFPTYPPVVDGNFVYVGEYWTIFTLNGDLPTAELACDPDLVVLAGFNEFRGTPGGAGRADGTVTDADADGPFADVAPESRMMWRGRVTNPKEGGDEYKATLHIFPLK